MIHDYDSPTLGDLQSPAVKRCDNCGVRYFGDVPHACPDARAVMLPVNQRMLWDPDTRGPRPMTPDEYAMLRVEPPKRCARCSHSPRAPDSLDCADCNARHAAEEAELP